MRRFAAFLLTLAMAVAQPQSDFEVVPASGWSPAGPGLCPQAQLRLESHLFPQDPDSRGFFCIQVSDAGNQTLDSWALQLRQSIRSEMNGKVLSEDDTAVSGQPAHKLFYTGHVKIDGEDYDAGHYSLAVLSKDKLYVLYGVCSQPNFDQHWEDIRAMGKSFRLL